MRTSRGASGMVEQPEMVIMKAMNKKDAEKVLQKFNCKPTEMPLIFANDPAIIGLGVKPGDMIKITRKSPTAGESVYYRYVVEI